MPDEVEVERDGPVAIVSNNRPDKHNAFTDPMDLELFEAFASIDGDPGVRAVVWRGNGKSFSSGRDVGSLGGAGRTEDISQLELMERGHRFAKRLMTLSAPVIVALKGWTIGGSFERALLADIRIASEGSRMMLPEVKHGVIPDTGGVARLFQIAGHGLTADLVLSGRVLDADEALRHGIVSRVVPDEELDDAARALAHEIAAAPAFTVKIARRVLSHLGTDEVARTIDEEAVAQTLVFASEDYAEMKAAKAEGREPRYRRR